MFEQTELGIPCGVLLENGEFSTIYCDTATGECFFLDAVMSYPRLIAEVSVDDPVEIDVDDLIPALEEEAYGECVGIIYDGEMIIKLLDESTAVRVPAEDPKRQEAERFQIDIYGDYEMDE